MRSKNVFIHIGTPKTGSTFLQNLLSNRLSELASSNFSVARSEFLKGSGNECQFLELSELILREYLDTHPRIKFPHLRLSSVKENFMRIVEKTFNESLQNLIISHEDLCFIRTNQEAELLQQLLSKYFQNIKIIVCLREPSQFLNSYIKQLFYSGIPLSDSPDSINNISTNSWIIDYEQIIRVYSSAFGKENVSIINYRKEFQFIRELWQALGLENNLISEKDIKWLNSSDSFSKVVDFELIDHGINGYNIIELRENFYSCRQKYPSSKSKNDHQSFLVNNHSELFSLLEL